MKATPYNLFMSALYGGRKGIRPPAGNPTSIACVELINLGLAGSAMLDPFTARTMRDTPADVLRTSRGPHPCP